MTVKRLLVTLSTVGLLGVASTAPEACQQFGTQLRCDLDFSQLSIGTQTAAEPTPAHPFRPRALVAHRMLLEDRAPAKRFRIDIQNFGVSPILCHRWGNETYCE